MKKVEKAVEFEKPSWFEESKAQNCNKKLRGFGREFQREEGRRGKVSGNRSQRRIEEEEVKGSGKVRRLGREDPGEEAQLFWKDQLFFPKFYHCSSSIPENFQTSTFFIFFAGKSWFVQNLIVVPPGSRKNFQKKMASFQEVEKATKLIQFQESEKNEKSCCKFSHISGSWKKLKKNDTIFGPISGSWWNFWNSWCNCGCTF